MAYTTNRKTYELKQDNGGDFKISFFKSSGPAKTKNLHKHDYYEVGYFDIGLSSPNNFARTENHRYKIDKSSFVLFPPGAKHHIMRGNAPLDRMLLNFTYEFANPIAELFDIDLKHLFQSPVLKFSDREISELKELSYEMYKEYRKDFMTPPQKNSRLKLLFAYFLYLLSTAELKPSPEEVEALKINDIIDYINRNYFDDLNLDFLSGKFYISKFELCRKIKSVTGLTFSSYLTRLRINHARELLESSMMTVNEISLQIGFHSQAYFSSAFKKSTGMSPNDYRKNFSSDKLFTS